LGQEQSLDPVEKSKNAKPFTSDRKGNPMNLEKRIEQLEKAIEAATQQHVVEVQLVVVTTRQEAAALAALRESQPPPAPRQPGRIVLKMVESTTAAEVLARHGIVLPPVPESDVGAGNGSSVVL
jgi:hypothetical protein